MIKSIYRLILYAYINIKSSLNGNKYNSITNDNYAHLFANNYNASYNSVI